MKNFLKTLLLTAILLVPMGASAALINYGWTVDNTNYNTYPYPQPLRQRVMVGTTTPYAQLTVTATSSPFSTQLFAVASSTGTYLFNVLGNGNVGVGTTTPGTLFSLGNTGAATSNFSVTSTSSLATGLNLKTGCVTYNGGACLGTGGGSSIDVGTGIVTQTGSGTFAGRTITTTGLNGLSVTNGNGVSGNPVINISNLYEGQNSIITLGTIVTGAWNANTIMVPYGGTGASSFGQGWIHSAGGVSNLTSSTSPTVNYITATSTTVASTFPYASSTALTVSGRTYLGTGGSQAVIGTTAVDTNAALRINNTSVANQLVIGNGSADTTHTVDIYTPSGSSQNNVSLIRTANTQNNFLQFQPQGANTSSNVNWLMGSVANSNNFSFSTWNGGSVTEYLTVTNNTGGGFVGLSSSTPSSLLSVGSSGTATSTVFVDSGTGKGSCLVMKDSDGTGFTFITANNGVLSASTVSCR